VFFGHLYRFAPITGQQGFKASFVDIVAQQLKLSWFVVDD
jgi:hypothetical protein